MRTDTDEQTDTQTHSHQLHGQKEFQETMCTQDCASTCLVYKVVLWFDEVIIAMKCKFSCG